MDFKNKSYVDFSQEENIVHMKKGLEELQQYLGKTWPHIFLGKEVTSEKMYDSVNPNKPSQVLGTFYHYDRSMDVDTLIKGAHDAHKQWNELGYKKRVEVIQKVHDNYVENIWLLSAVQVLEIGKSYIEAYADVCEAIDFLAYDWRRAKHEYERKLVELPPTCGNKNRRVLVPHGVFLTLNPFNFECAIGTDQMTKPLLMGNSVIASSSNKSPLTARLVFKMFQDAFDTCNVKNEGILNYAPGGGAAQANDILKHPLLKGLCFTGSSTVLDSIISTHGMEKRTHGGKLVIAAAETSGVNAIYIHKDADMGVAGKAIAAALCGLSGQKCSALSSIIAHKDVHDTVLEAANKELDAIKFGSVKDGAYLGAVITQKAKENIQNQIEEVKKEFGAEVVYQKEIGESPGFNVAPTILGVDISEIKNDAKKLNKLRSIEIFAPVCHILKVEDEQEAEKVFNASDFALTGGICSQDSNLIEHAIQNFRAGNFYVNRKVTGALVGSEPFGGLVSKSSLSGKSAGSAHCLTNFYSDKSISGFFPEN